jgi:hypothetical protein
MFLLCLFDTLGRQSTEFEALRVYFCAVQLAMSGESREPSATPTKRSADFRVVNELL